MTAFSGHLSAQLRHRSGAVAAGALVNVFAAGTTTPATVYRNRTGSPAIANPMVTNDDGGIDCYAAAGAYDLVPVDAGLPALRGVVVSPDAASGAAAAAGIGYVTAQGTLTLDGSTPVVVSQVAVTATSRIMLTTQAPAGTPTGAHWVSARSVGVSFSVTGIALDTSTVGYVIVEPAA